MDHITECCLDHYTAMTLQDTLRFNTQWEYDITILNTMREHEGALTRGNRVPTTTQGTIDWRGDVEDNIQTQELHAPEGIVETTTPNSNGIQVIVIDE